MLLFRKQTCSNIGKLQCLGMFLSIARENLDAEIHLLARCQCFRNDVAQAFFDTRDGDPLTIEFYIDAMTRLRAKKLFKLVVCGRDGGVDPFGSADPDVANGTLVLKFCIQTAARHDAQGQNTRHIFG